ncbi:lytic transglycosylase domain-containing protein [Teichococcus oryzae]|uniref:Lytic transglycosylase domain-containing protein n=1 Tax=Teichococcus oryzae TaxID=1608942 RepID=A0A5B2TBV8_9PROT|nr:lytic transglycosylase domain-containing protein [Pseudoroseomonas oryzae]KAA2211659.1 lytic transglycosylase domain-containing protein [Pseudoroseomonas oryzae]
MTPFRLRPTRAHARAVMAVGALALLAACGSSQQARSPVTATAAAQAAAYPQPSTYDPPGSASDPWGPYIKEASRRFDVPERWIREVMRQESAGKVNARSPVGAMGLMQVMPGTYAELRDRYGLGSDPYHPWNSIMAGTAYVRQMYELYGSPAFLAAYNAGPRRLEEYLWSGRGLPAETRNYVARIGPRIVGTHPGSRAAPEVYAAAEIPLNIPPGPRRGDTATMLALREQRNAVDPGIRVATLPAGPVVRMEPIPDGSTYEPVQVASLDPAVGSNVVRMEPIPDGSTYAAEKPAEPAPLPAPVAAPVPAASPSLLAAAALPRSAAAATVMAAAAAKPASPTQSRIASAFAEAPRAVSKPPVTQPVRETRLASAPRGPGFSLIGTAHAAPVVAPAANTLRLPGQGGAPTGTNGEWGVQVGAFASANLARNAANQARGRLGISGARTVVETVGSGSATLYRARVIGLSRDSAQAACSRLRSSGACLIVAPDA